MTWTWFPHCSKNLYYYRTSEGRSGGKLCLRHHVRFTFPTGKIKMEWRRPSIGRNLSEGIFNKLHILVNNILCLWIQVNIYANYEQIKDADTFHLFWFQLLKPLFCRLGIGNKDNFKRICLHLSCVSFCQTVQRKLRFFFSLYI